MDFVLGLLGGLGSSVSSGFAWAQAAIAALTANLFQTISDVNSLAEASQSVWTGLFKFLKFGWLFGAGGMIAKLLGWIRQLQAWLKKHLAGVINFLKKVRAWFDRYYRQHILPQIQLIQRIRKYLLVLRLLHIHIPIRHVWRREMCRRKNTAGISVGTARALPHTTRKNHAWIRVRSRRPRRRAWS